MTETRSRTGRRTVLVAIVLALALLVFGAGQAAAHNPAGIQTAGEDGPHYDDDPRTGSDTAFEKNPTLGGEYNDNAPGGSSVGNAQVADDGH